MDRQMVWVPALVILVIALVSAGCMTFPSSSQGSSATTSKGVAPESPAMAPVPVSGSNTVETGVVVDQKIVYTAHLSLEVKDVPTAVDTMKTLVIGRGGISPRPASSRSVTAALRWSSSVSRPQSLSTPSLMRRRSGVSSPSPRAARM